MVATQPTSPASTFIGVAAAATVPWLACGAVVGPAPWMLGPDSQPPDIAVAPSTTATTVMPPSMPTGIRNPRPAPVAVSGRPRRAASCSMPAAVRAHRSRGASGAVSRSPRSASWSAV